MKKFGISTHLYHEQRLDKAHLIEIATNGFDTVEVFATRSHFDYHDSAAVRSLRDWLIEAGLELHSIHAPITDVFANGRSQRSFSTASRNADERRATIREMEAALSIASVIPFKYLVVHLGVPVAQHPGADDNHRESAVRSVEEIHRMAAAAGVRIALEVMGNDLSTPSDLVDILERSFDGADLGICMDVGHAHMLGDTAEAIETTSEYLATTHIHDNRRQSDDHLVPFQGNINWAATIMAFEKIGYDGVLMYEVKAAESPRAVLERSVAARRRLEALMSASFMADLEVGTTTEE
jgi:sugar phosphate isomerase/epimerase